MQHAAALAASASNRNQQRPSAGTTMVDVVGCFFSLCSSRIQPMLAIMKSRWAKQHLLCFTFTVLCNTESNLFFGEQNTLFFTAGNFKLEKLQNSALFMFNTELSIHIHGLIQFNSPKRFTIGTSI